MTLHRLLCSGRSIALVLLASLIPAVATAESWTDLSGTRTIEAKMVGLWGDSVVLLLDDGRRVTVNLANLQAESRIQAQNLGKEQKKFREGVVSEIKGQAQAAAAPAPDPIPKPPKAPAYVQPQPNTPVAQHLRLFWEQVEAGHMVVWFDALPPSYRKDIGELAKLGARKINPAAWQGLMGSIHQIGDVIVTKQRWFFSHPRFVAMGPDATERIEEVVLLVAGYLRDGFDPQAMDLNRLETMPLRDWLLDRDQAMSPYVSAINNLAIGTSMMTFEVVSEKDGVATVKQNGGNVQYANVEGFWVPKEMNDNWQEWMAKAREAVAAMPDGTLMSDPMSAMLPAMIMGKIGPLAGAGDEKSYHSAMDDLFAEVQPMATTALAGMNVGGKRRPGSGYGDDYGDSYGEEMSMEDYEDMEDSGAGDYEEQMRQQAQGPGGGGQTSGRKDPNPNIGARLEDDLRNRNQDLRNQQPR